MIPHFQQNRVPACSRSSVRPYPLVKRGCQKSWIERQRYIPPYLLVQRFSHLSLASARRPEELEFNQSRLNHTRFALTTQWIDDFLLRGLWPRHATLPPSFRNSSQVAGISRVCTGASNTPGTFRYAHFLPLMRRTISLRIAWVPQPAA